MGTFLRFVVGATLFLSVMAASSHSQSAATGFVQNQSLGNLIQASQAPDQTLRSEVAEVSSATKAVTKPFYAVAPGERRALWVVRDAMTSVKLIDKMVVDARQAGVTDLFVQVRGRGDAYYLSKTEPLPATLAKKFDQGKGFDPLERVLQQAQPDMRVHAWINTYLVASKPAHKLRDGHVALENPEWIARTPQGKSMLRMSRSDWKRNLTEGAYLDPAHPNVTPYILRLADELTQKYALDGLHLDYVRYPHMKVGFIEDESERCAMITDMVRQLRMQMRMTRPGMILSAAVKPDPAGARSRYGQDWVRWVEEDLVDVVAPMMYSPSMKIMKGYLRDTKAAVDPSRVWAGIAVYNQSLAAAEQKILEAEMAGMGGISIFSYNSVPQGAKGLKRLNGR
ncbi:MAG: family 10 glycosylhydrolase [Candidatus Eisenbacteria bacterium]|uniref:Family 10 glycosylhydrolase n=1 Tax=Eiseniibacteriota bacterium TaxID=2212470 RepID=A0A7Y2EBL2_UNCEI|nr:family 10 glycosylhydrolase [Candidatus Eisenbacteria bacterium]